MVETNTAQTSTESGWLWLIKILSGLLILVIITIHLIVNHFVGSASGLLTWAEVVAYYQNPLIPLMEAAFLIFAVSHAMIGLRSIVIDLHPSRAALNTITWLLTGVGVVAIVYGIWLLWAIVAQGR
jgi:succinate dehydrogenase / fumarate reductase membrane anchor subunit